MKKIIRYYIFAENKLYTSCLIKSWYFQLDGLTLVCLKKQIRKNVHDLYIPNVCVSQSYSILLVLSVFRARVSRRGAEADEDHEKRDGGLSVHRQQRGTACGQQTYLHQRSLWVIVITVRAIEPDTAYFDSSALAGNAIVSSYFDLQFRQWFTCPISWSGRPWELTWI